MPLPIQLPVAGKSPSLPTPRPIAPGINVPRPIAPGINVPRPITPGINVPGAIAPGTVQGMKPSAPIGIGRIKSPQEILGGKSALDAIKNNSPEEVMKRTENERIENFKKSADIHLNNAQKLIKERFEATDKVVPIKDEDGKTTYIGLDKDGKTTYTLKEGEYTITMGNTPLSRKKIVIDKNTNSIQIFTDNQPNDKGDSYKTVILFENPDSNGVYHKVRGIHKDYGSLYATEI